MNLFRSEDHARRWTHFVAGSEPGIRALGDLVALFGLPRYRERLAPDYLQRVAALSRDLPAALERLGQSSPFWRISPPQ